MIKSKFLFNYLIIILLTIITFSWTFWIFHKEIIPEIILAVILIRLLTSTFIFKDYSLSWSKVTPTTFFIKSIVYFVAFFIYMPIFYGQLRISFFISELFLYLFIINFLMYAYYLFVNRSKIEKTKSMVIYGAGRAGLQLEKEFQNSEYKIKYFIDDDPLLQNRSIDTIKIISPEILKQEVKDNRLDLLLIAIPSADKNSIKSIYNSLHSYFYEVKVLPTIEDILNDTAYTKQLKDLSVEDLLARYPKDLDKDKIASFIEGKVIAITGAGGSIGSEICRQCERYNAKQLILIDNSEYNLYSIFEELNQEKSVPVMQSVVNKEFLEKTFQKYQPEIVIHAAAYKHVPLVESNIEEGIINNIVGTQSVIDTSVKYGVKKLIMVSTDKAVRPTNVMGATKRICELYAQNSNGKGTDIVAVRFGNVLGSSGSVIPKFKKQIENGGPITVTHPDITRYFMLIPEACELVLQSGAIGTGGEIFILDMGEPIKIVDLAKKMCELSGREDIEIVFTGLRPGEKLYEELLIDESDAKTEYASITVAKPTYYNIEKLSDDIENLLKCANKIKKLKEIIPEFTHQINK